MKSLHCVVICTIILFSANISKVLAADKDRFDGTVGLGFIFFTIADNLNPDGSKSYLYDLQSSAGSESKVYPFIMPKVTWDIGEQDGVKLFFNSLSAGGEDGGFGFNIGGNYTAEDKTLYSISTFFSPFKEVWQDPYLTGAERRSSDAFLYGFALSAKNIMGTEFGVRLAYAMDDVEDDLLGQLYPQMARDGSIYRLRLDYGFDLTDSVKLLPSAVISRGDYDGESSSYYKYKIALKAQYMKGRFMAAPQAYYSYQDYDETDPIFAAVREEDGYGVNLMGNYMAPFGWNNWSATVLLGYSRGDNSIDFYDTKGSILGMFLTYRF